MSGFVTIPDRVPVETIAGLTNAALRVYLERHGWGLYDEWTHVTGARMVAFRRGDTVVTAASHDSFVDHALRMSQAVGDIVNAGNLRSADVIAELQRIQQETST